MTSWDFLWALSKWRLQEKHREINVVNSGLVNWYLSIEWKHTNFQNYLKLLVKLQSPFYLRLRLFENPDLINPKREMKAFTYRLGILMWKDTPFIRALLLSNRVWKAQDFFTSLKHVTGAKSRSKGCRILCLLLKINKKRLFSEGSLGVWYTKYLVFWALEVFHREMGLKQASWTKE